MTKLDPKKIKIEAPGKKKPNLAAVKKDEPKPTKGTKLDPKKVKY